MTGDLLVITPSRGRPENVKRLLETVRATRQAITDVHVCVDDDDPELAAYRDVVAEHGSNGDRLDTGPRMGLVEWTNKIAVPVAAEYRYLASLGDDHVPRTKGWDAALIRAIEDMGGTGIAYPWDGTREDIPEAVVMSSDIVAALGWMCEPSLQHYWPDQVWADLGRGAGCLRHCRAVWVEHVHPATGKVPGDKTYQESATKIAEDKAAYAQWRAEHMAADVATVRALRERALQPA
jgi:hypothetical protein